MIRLIRQWLAVRRLNRIIARNKAAPTTREYARRREASKLGWQRRKGAAV